MESVNIKELNERIERESSFVDLLSIEMGKVIVGQKHLVDNLLIGLLANGHILLEGVPGLAKTLAINTLSQAVDAKFSRIQLPRTSCLPMSSVPSFIPRRMRVSRSIRALSSRTSSSLMKSTEALRRSSPPSSKPCRSARLLSETQHSSSRSPSS